MLAGHVAVSGGRMAASLLALNEGYGDSAVGFVVGLYSVLSAFLAVGFGRWADRFGPRRVARIGLVSILIGVSLPVAWTTVPATFVGAVMCGTGVTVLAIAIQYSVGSLTVATQQSRVALFGWLTLGQSLSAVLGPAISGAVIDTAGYRAAFAVLAVGTLAALALSSNIPSSAKGHAPRAEATSHWLDLLRDPMLRQVYILSVINSLSWDSFTFLGPVLGHRAQLSATVIGLVMSSFALGTVSIRVFLASAGHHFGEWRTLSISFLLVALVYVVLPFAQPSWAMFALAYLLGSGLGCGQPNALSLLHRYAPDHRIGEAIGMRSLLGNASGVCIPWLFGATVAFAGVWPVCWVIATAATVAAVRARHGLTHSA